MKNELLSLIEDIKTQLDLLTEKIKSYNDESSSYDEDFELLDEAIEFTTEFLNDR